MGINNKRVLITAGSTWVAIDGVRVISNIATGSTGILLAERLNKLGCRVTLLLGPVEACCLNKNIRLIRYNFFDELKTILIKELKSKQYDFAIHSAAVSDYKPAHKKIGKIKSNLKSLQIKLIPAEKLVALFKKIQPCIKLIIFKLELRVSKDTLIKRAINSMQQYKADFAVANTLTCGKYQALILDKEGNQINLRSKKELASRLSQLLTSI